MSDITKKIFSIEQADESPVLSDIEKPKLATRSVPEIVTRPVITPAAESIPDFVTRDTVHPRMTPPSNYRHDIKPPKSAGWIILAFACVYIVASGLYFGLPLIDQPIELLPMTGLVILMGLPLILLLLLWRALRHLTHISFQNSQLNKAAELLVSPDTEALKRTETLSSGVRNEISKVNNALSNTVEAFQEFQRSVAIESKAIEATGQSIANRSEVVGQNLTQQKEALESMSGTFNARISSLSTQISETGATLDGICTSAESKLLNAGETLQKATVSVDETVTSSTSLIADKISKLETASQNFTVSNLELTSSLTTSAENLGRSESAFAENSGKLQILNAETKSQISDLQATIGQGYEMLEKLREAAETRASALTSHYHQLSAQIKQSEDDTLAAQGQTARMVETNLSQMRRDFSRMETDLKSLQAKLKNLKSDSTSIAENEVKSARLNLVPLVSDFPPVEPNRPIVDTKVERISETPLNLGLDMEIKSVDEPLLNFEPDLVRRPGELDVETKAKGFGRRKTKEEKSGWRWRDMLGSLERPDDDISRSQAGVAGDAPSDLNVTSREIDAVSLLSAVQLSPSAIVDEGTVIEATQSRINSGEPGLSALVTRTLPEAVSHLKDSMNSDAALKQDLQDFTLNFAKMIGNTPPTAPALRAALGSPEGRAYLLCAAAFRPVMRG